MITPQTRFLPFDLFDFGLNPFNRSTEAHERPLPESVDSPPPATRLPAHLTTFRQGDAEGLPFADGSFDAVISECSFCTFPDKATAAAEMARVLHPGGRLGLTDMTVRGPLPDDMQTLLVWVACVTAASTPEDYVATLRTADFTDFTVEDQRDLNEGKRLARRAIELIEAGVVGHTLIAARKE